MKHLIYDSKQQPALPSFILMAALFLLPAAQAQIFIPPITNPATDNRCSSVGHGTFSCALFTPNGTFVDTFLFDASGNLVTSSPGSSSSSSGVSSTRFRRETLPLFIANSLDLEGVTFASAPYDTRRLVEFVLEILEIVGADGDFEKVVDAAKEDIALERNIKALEADLKRAESRKNSMSKEEIRRAIEKSRTRIAHIKIDTIDLVFKAIAAADQSAAAAPVLERYGPEGLRSYRPGGSE